MTGPQTLKELMQAKDLSIGEARRLTSTIFNGMTVIVQDIIPYKVTMPVLNELPDHVQQFLVKAILECDIVNLLDANEGTCQHGGEPADCPDCRCS